MVINLITQKIVNNEVREPTILRGIHTQNMDTKLSLAQTMCI